MGSLMLTGRVHAAAVGTGAQPPGSTLMLTGRIGVEISGLVGARGSRIGLPDSLSEACYSVLAVVILSPR